MVIERFAVHLINLDPTVGSEIQKTRPCVVVSPDVLNSRLRTAIVAPLTTTIRPYAFRINCKFRGKPGQIALDQIRTVDQSRFVRRLGALNPDEQTKVLDVLRDMFAP